MVQTPDESDEHVRTLVRAGAYSGSCTDADTWRLTSEQRQRIHINHERGGGPFLLAREALQIAQRPI
jgi:hypothetical protein